MLSHDYPMIIPLLSKKPIRKNPDIQGLYHCGLKKKQKQRAAPPSRFIGAHKLWQDLVGHHWLGQFVTEATREGGWSVGWHDGTGLKEKNWIPDVVLNYVKVRLNMLMLYFCWLNHCDFQILFGILLPNAGRLMFRTCANRILVSVK